MAQPPSPHDREIRVEWSGRGWGVPARGLSSVEAGVVALEGLLRLPRLAGDRLATTLVMPADPRRATPEAQCMVRLERRSHPGVAPPCAAGRGDYWVDHRPQLGQ